MHFCVKKKFLSLQKDTHPVLYNYVQSASLFLGQSKVMNAFCKQENKILTIIFYNTSFM